MADEVGSTPASVPQGDEKRGDEKRRGCWRRHSWSHGKQDEVHDGPNRHGFGGFPCRRSDPRDAADKGFGPGNWGDFHHHPGFPFGPNQFHGQHDESKFGKPWFDGRHHWAGMRGNMHGCRGGPFSYGGQHKDTNFGNPWFEGRHHHQRGGMHGCHRSPFNRYWRRRDFGPETNPKDSFNDFVF